MKRIYVCCILLILVFVLAAFYGVFTGSGGAAAGFQARSGEAAAGFQARSGEAVEGFQARTAPPDSIKCTMTTSNYTNDPTKEHKYWFCDNKNHADALMEGNYVLPPESICIKRTATDYTCLERDRKDRRYLLNRQKRAICDLLTKATKDVDDTVAKGNALNTIATDTLNTITRTEPDIDKLKEKNPQLMAFLDDQSETIQQQKTALNTFVDTINRPIAQTTGSRNNELDPALQRMRC